MVDVGVFGRYGGRMWFGGVGGARFDRTEFGPRRIGTVGMAFGYSRRGRIVGGWSGNRGLIGWRGGQFSDSRVEGREGGSRRRRRGGDVLFKLIGYDFGSLRERARRGVVSKAAVRTK